MNSITLIELAGNGILIAIAYGLVSLLLGILFGYAINSKYKNQVEELEQEKVRLQSSVSSLESDLEESKKARSNADGEISLLRNQLREREARIKETEGKLAIKSRLYDELTAKTEKESKESKFDDEVAFVESTPIKTRKIEPSTVAEKSDKPASEIKGVDDIASSLVSDEKQEEKPKEESTKTKRKKKSSKKDKDKKAGKRGRPKGSKNKKSDKEPAKTEDKPKAKRGRPKGSTNKKSVAKSSSTKSETKSTTKGKRGRPKGSTNKTDSTETKKTTTAKRGRPKGSTNSTVGKTTSAPSRRRGRPKGSTNKTTTTPKKATPAKRGRPAKSKTNPTPATTMKRAKATSSGRGRKKDDLKIIEGIGPKMEEALRNGGIKTFNKMSKTSSDKLKDILVKANTRFGIAATESWPDQAKLAANGEFDKLKELQDSLNRGRK